MDAQSPLNAHTIPRLIGDRHGTITVRSGLWDNAPIAPPDLRRAADELGGQPIFPQVADTGVGMSALLVTAGPMPAEAPIPGPVLVIDDEENVRLVAARMLERRGFTVLSAADGATGVALYEGSAVPVAAVLLDLSMPQMSGVEVAEALHRIDPNVRIVLMSGYAEDDARRRFADLGIAAFLQKPFTLGDLGMVMSLVLGAKL